MNINIQKTGLLISICTLSFMTGMVTCSCHQLVRETPSENIRTVDTDLIEYQQDSTSSVRLYLKIKVNDPLLETPPKNLSQKAQENWLLLQQPAIRAYLEMISFAEGTQEHGYYTMFGGSKLSHLEHHPGGAAAGKYQFLSTTWEEVSKKLGLTDFSPLAQDLAAIEKLKERRIIHPLRQGELNKAIARGAREWASLPYNERSFYGMNGQIGGKPPQPTKTLQELGQVYQLHLP